MKRLSWILITVMLCSLFVAPSVSAKVGDVVGKALHTDIVAYINHYAINSYAVNGQSCIVAEELRNYGFDVVWDGGARSLTISRNADVYVSERYVTKDGAPGSLFANTLETDIAVYANGVKLTSYAINGYTMIPIEELWMFGEVYWVAEERAVKLWVDGLSIRSAKQQVPVSYVEETTQPTSTGNGGGGSNTQYNGSSVYVTPSGKRYHYDKECAGKNGRAITLANAQSRGYTPCRTCAD